MLGRSGGDGQAPKREGRILADFDGTGYGSDYLTLEFDERVFLLANRQEDAGWAFGARSDGTQGWFPASYWEPIEAPEPPPSSMAAAAMTGTKAGVGSSSSMMREELGDPASRFAEQVPGRPPMPSWLKGPGGPASSTAGGPSSAKGASSLTSALSSFGLAADDAPVGQMAQQGASRSGGGGSGPAMADPSPASLAAVVARAAEPAAKRGGGTSSASSKATQNAEALAGLAADSRRQLLALLGRQVEEDALAAQAREARALAPASAKSSGSKTAAPKAEPSWVTAARVAAGRGAGSHSSAADLDANGSAGSSGRPAEDMLDASSSSGPPGGTLPQPFTSWQRRIYSRSTLLHARLALQAEEEIPASAEERALLLGMQLAPRLAKRQEAEDGSGQKLREGAIATLLELAGGSAKVGQLAAAVLALGIKTGSHRQVCQSICVEVCSKPETFVPLLEGALGILELNKLTVALRSGFPSDSV